MKYLPIDDVKPGDILAKTLFDDDFKILLTANSKLSELKLHSIEAMGFAGLYIYDGSPDNDDILSDKARQKALVGLKHINIDDCLYVANAITNKIIENPKIMYELMNVCSYDTRTYVHCIDVAILSTMIGVNMGLSNQNLYDLSQAALLHDIGKTAIPETILNKPGKLTPEEYDLMKSHCEFGYNMLTENENISEIALQGILYHHENEDGTGYPHNLISDKIPTISKIIHAADVYDALVSKRSYKDSLNPADALEYLMGHTEMFDINVIHAMIGCIALYPTGTRVRLSNGECGTIFANTYNYPQRPVINLDTGRRINLMEILNVTITGIMK
ncbi:HD-GYP domain-containing protein [bacterium]|nr:HD-GYP domain-containing protein [bacterium]